MAQWRIKEMSDLTKVSVRTLHHYDKIGLLKPSMRTSNSYRWYSQQDLAKLQQIIALKLFGFSLEQIKSVLRKPSEIHEHLLAQQRMLDEQAEQFQRAQDTLADVLQRYESSDSLDWKDLITLIDRNHAMAKLKETWVDRLSGNQQEDELAFQQAYPHEFDAWQKTSTLMNNMQLGAPGGPDGQQAVEVFIKYQQALAKWTKAKKAYKKVSKAEASALLESIEKAIQKQKTEGQPTSPEGIVWFMKAQSAYRLRSWERLHDEIKKNLDIDPESAAGKILAAQWRKTIAEHFVGETPQDFHIGTMLLMQDAQLATQLDSTTQTPEQAQQMAQNAMKLMLDPAAITWLERALLVH